MRFYSACINKCGRRVLTGVVNQVTGIVNFPVTCKVNSKNENGVSSACVFGVFFIATEHPELTPTYPQTTQPKEGRKTLF